MQETEARKRSKNFIQKIQLARVGVGGGWLLGNSHRLALGCVTLGKLVHPAEHFVHM